jgi:hypothetical protein
MLPPLIYGAAARVFAPRRAHYALRRCHAARRRAAASVAGIAVADYAISPAAAAFDISLHDIFSSRRASRLRCRRRIFTPFRFDFRFHYRAII